ncbi:hypothetical protein N202_03735 [Helicobacter pylori UM067]|nr:hypothetical protein N202_03735 [Helicobacter pylori UM067]
MHKASGNLLKMRSFLVMEVRMILKYPLSP